MATVTVTIVTALPGGFTVDFATSDGTAIEPGDYTATTGTLNFLGNANESQTFDVPINDDALVEASETINVSLSNVSNIMVDASDTAVISITDNDTATLTVDDITVDESAGTAMLTVTVDNAVDGGFTVDFATADDTAVQPGDYTATTGTLNFVGNAGETQTFTVPIIDDALIEAAESFNVTLSNPSNASVDSTDTAAVSITDNDAAALTIDDVTFDESAGATATVTVTLNNVVPGGFTVDFSTSDGTAVQPGDYTATTGTLNFAGNAGETQTFAVPIIDDGLVELAESVNVALSNSSNAAVSTVDTAVVTITDNDTTTITVNSVIVDEAAGTATVQVSSSAASSFAIDVPFTTVDDTATAPADYTTTSGTLNFVGNAGEIQTLTVPIIDDALTEAAESFVIDLMLNSTSVVLVDGNVTITDNDATNNVDLSVSIAQDSSPVVFDDPQRYVITVSNAGPEASDSVVSTVAFPDGVTVGNITSSQGTVTVDGLIATINVGTLANGASATITAFATPVTAPVSFDVNANVVGSGAEADASNNAATISTNVIVQTDLEITITDTPDPVTVGENVTYTVVIDNLVSSPALDVQATTVIPADMTVLSAESTLGTTTINGNQIDTTIPLLAADAFPANPNSIATITIVATAPNTAGQVIANTSVAINNGTDLDLTNNTATATTSVVAATTGSIAGSVYVDANNNGIRDQGEQGIPNVMITLGGAGDAVTLTDAQGNYQFAGLPAGTYTVTETQPAGFDDGIDSAGIGANATTGNDSFTNLVLAAGVNATAFNFGELAQAVAMLRGQVFCDANGDNEHDQGEEVVGTLVFIDANDNGRFDNGEQSTTTDINGNYQFNNVAGSVNVSVVVPVTCNTITDEPGIRRSIVPVGNVARSITSADIDLDGDQDLLVVSDMSGTLTVVRNDPDGFNQGTDFDVGARPQSVFAFQPVDTQPALIAVANLGRPGDGGSVMTMVGQGMQSNTRTGSSGPIDVIIADFDQQGTPDVLSANFRDSFLELELGETGQVVQVDTLAEQILSIASGNLTGAAATPEVVVSGFGYGDNQTRLEVFQMDNAGGVSKADSIVVSSQTVEVSVENIIQNQNLEFGEIVTLQSFGQIMVYPMNADGTIGAGIATQVSDGATAFDFGDFNKDGIQDVAVANLGGQFIELFSGTGDGRFALITTVRNVSAPSDLVVEDLNDDGFDDIAVANFYTDLNINDPTLPPQFMLPSTTTILQLEIASRDVSVTSNLVQDFRFPTADAVFILDTNGDNRVTAVDALRVINVIERESAGEGEQVGRAATDVNGDGSTSAVDALMIINYLSRDSVADANDISIDDLIPLDEDERNLGTDAVDEVLSAGLF